LYLFYSNAFAFLEFKQEKDISSDANDLREHNTARGSRYLKNFLILGLVLHGIYTESFH